MASGYALAVYLGHSQTPLKVTLGGRRTPKSAADTTATEAQPTSETAESVAEEAPHAIPALTEKEIPEQVPQLDVKDLMANAESATESQPSDATDSDSNVEAANGDSTPPVDEQADEVLETTPESATAAENDGETQETVAETNQDETAQVETAAVSEEADDEPAAPEAPAASESPDDLSDNDTSVTSEEVDLPAAKEESVESTVGTEETAAQSEQNELDSLAEMLTTAAAAAPSDEEPNNEQEQSNAANHDTTGIDASSVDAEEAPVDEQSKMDDQQEQIIDEADTADPPTQPSTVETTLEEAESPQSNSPETAPQVNDSSPESEKPPEHVTKDEVTAFGNDPKPNSSGDTSKTTSAEPVADDIAKGLEAFQQQLAASQSDEQATGTSAESTTELPSEDVLNGLEAFQKQLEEQATGSDEALPTDDTSAEAVAETLPTAPPAEGTEESLLEGIEAFQQQLQKQQPAADAVAATTSDDEELAPEVLEGIEEFRSQLKKMKDAPPQVEAEEKDEPLEAAKAN